MRNLVPWFAGGPNEAWNNVFFATQYAYNMEATHAATVWRGDWLTATAYSVGDGVYIPGTNVNYICLTAHTSGTFATDLAAVKWQAIFDVHNFYGRSASKIFKALSEAYDGDRTKYNAVIEVQLFGNPSPSANRFNSARYVLETGQAGDAAKLWATHQADAPYVSSGYYNTATETAMVAEWVNATEARKREIEDEYVLAEDDGVNGTAWVGSAIKAVTWANNADTMGLIPCQYEGGPNMNQAGTGGNTGLFRHACKFSRQWKWILSKRYAYWESLGYEYPSQYSFVASNSFGAFDPDIYTPTPIWEAFVLRGQGGKTFRLTAS